MLIPNEPQHTVSKCWFTPDFQFGLHHFRYLADSFNCLPHTHGEHNFIVCLDHGFECVVNEQAETMEPGDLLVINPGEVHKSSYKSNQVPSEGITLYLTQRALESLLRRMRVRFDGKRQGIRFLGKVHDPKVLQLVQELLSEWDGQKEGYDVVIQSCMLQILVYLIRNRLEPAIVEKRSDLPRQLPSWQMDWAIEYMNARGKSDFSLIELCSKLGISQPHFIQLFKNSTGMMIPHDYYNRLLIDRAQRLLQTADYSIKEIAFELGFKSDSHFCSLFRSFTGMTPTTYQLCANSSAE
ncbi:MAG: AraC family transcriptional regulator [Acidobacteria bacterium]|nr:AraC family transcriptional regulator [Acidobacteriota bacterium]MCI0720453.1 AraC family transcriptional regulator [Acidobacteriota bacterium]